jgi:hypothetical protein
MFTGPAVHASDGHRIARTIRSLSKDPTTWIMQLADLECAPESADAA